jgi:protein-S-isoprenylcysteine O-methyltransferase Ste14
MIIPILATITRVLWGLIEYPYLRRYEVRPDKDSDKHSRELWDVANVIETVGMLFGFTSIGRIHAGTKLVAVLGLTLLFVGITIRWVAIYTLGEYFTGTVLIKKNHRLIQSGLYKRVRHPAYTGALLAHLGLGLSFSNWITLSLSVAPFIAAALYRMNVEERALQEEFGEAYIRYSNGTKRLIPKLY